MAGGLARQNRPGKAGIVRTRCAQFDKLFLSFGPPVPWMSAAGFAGAGLLMLLAVGFATRRRLWQRSRG